MSAVVHVEPGKAPAGVSAARLERVTEAAFGQRRKMLRQSLKALPGALEALEKLGIDPQRRAETLSVTEVAAEASELTGALSSSGSATHVPVPTRRSACTLSPARSKAWGRPLSRAKAAIRRP